MRIRDVFRNMDVFKAFWAEVVSKGTTRWEMDVIFGGTGVVQYKQECIES